MTTARRQVPPLAILIVVGFGVFVAADDLTVVSTMLRPIIGDLGIVLPDGLDEAAWIVNAYLIAYVAVMPFAGRLSDIIGRRRVFVGSLVLFLIGSILVPLATSLGPFLVGRVITAIGGGAMVPVGLAIIGDVYPPGRRARALGILGSIETMGWVWGPLFGAFLIRYLSWQWQFYLNIPLALIGIVAAWWAFAGQDQPDRTARIDWVGAGSLTAFLVALNIALLGSAEIQSVSGLDELTGGGGPNYAWFYLLAVVALVVFLRRERRTDQPLIDLELFAGRNLTAAVVANFLMGAALVVAMVDVPLFINVVEIDLERSAVLSGWLLSALTAAMAVTSYLGGRVTERWWYRPPVLAGFAGATVAYLAMGLTWSDTSAYPVMAVQLAILGAGLGLVIAPTTAAVVDAAPAQRRGTAAGLVIVVRLIGLSVGLSGLTAWALFRFNQLRGTLDLPPLGSDGYQAALRQAQTDLTTSALAETFLAAAVVAAAGIAVALAMRHSRTVTTPVDSSGSTTGLAGIATDGADTAAPAPDPPGTVGAVGAEVVTGTPAAAGDTLDTTLSGSAPRPRRPPGHPDRTDDHPIPTSDPEEGPGMMAFLSRPLPWLRLGLITVVALLLIGVVMMSARIGSLSDEITAMRTDLDRVESGAALFASQVTAFQQQLSELAPTVGEALDEAIAGLESFRTSTLEFDLPVDQTIPLDAEVVLDRTITIPVETSLPIDETIETTITVEGPFRARHPGGGECPRPGDRPHRPRSRLPDQRDHPRPDGDRHRGSRCPLPSPLPVPSLRRWPKPSRPGWRASPRCSVVSVADTWRRRRGLALSPDPAGARHADATRRITPCGGATRPPARSMPPGDR